jgi:ribulose-phosphate 3-epimerase
VVGLDRRIELSVSLLAADLSRLSDEIDRLIEIGVDRIHCDISDGNLISPPIFGPVLLQALSKTKARNMDIHFWLEKPEFRIGSYLKIMDAKIVRTVYFPLETCLKPFSVAEDVRNAGFRPGVCILPITPVSYVSPLLPYVDELMIMTSDPVYERRTVLSFSLDKVRDARDLIEKEGLHVKIAVDGGIDQEFLPKLIQAGADVLIIGSMVFHEGRIKENIQSIRDVISRTSRDKH